MSWQEPPAIEGETWAPLNTPEGQSYLLRLCEVIQPDAVFFDNVQSLVSGDMKDEVPWNETMPIVLELTKRDIGQVWLDHTGHDTSRQYGASRKAWPFDTVGVIVAQPGRRERGELAFTLSFDAPGGKTRNRTPDNWDEFAPQIIRLREDTWTAEEITAENLGAGRNGNGRKGPAPKGEKYHEALIDALAITDTTGETTVRAWIGECERKGLLEPTAPDDSRQQRERKRALFSKYRRELVMAGWVACDGERVFNLRK